MSPVLRFAISLLAAVGVLQQVVRLAHAQPADDVIWGINGHPLVSYPGVPIDVQLARVADLGMRMYRVDVSHMSQADRLEELIDKARELNVTILPVLTPSLDLDKTEADALYRAAHDFASYFVKRFKGHVGVWELGNELENYAIIQPCEMQDDGKQYNCAWGPAAGVTPLEYFGPRWRKVSSVLKGLSDATKAADRTARKAMGTAGWGHYGAFDRMRQDGIEWDISVWHSYSGDLESQLLRVAAYGKPIWLTEFNHPRGSHEGAFVAQSEGLGKMIEEIRALRQRYKLDAAFVYELLDETYWAPSYEGSMGLIYLVKGDDGQWREDGAKPAHCTVQTSIKGGWRMGDRAKAPTRAVWFPVPAPTRSCNLCLIDSRDGRPETLVQYASCLALGRQADAKELALWRTAIVNGDLSPDQLLERMVTTRIGDVERLRGAPMPNLTFVAFLYRLLHDHDPDGHGLGAYTSAIDDGRATRAQTIRAMIDHGLFKWRHSGLFRPIN